MKDLSGRTAFVTGGASGIGLGIAKALLGAGMNVAIADVRQDHLDAATAELDGGARVAALKLDVTDRAAYAAAADAVEARFGPLHVLVNNAGVAVVGPVELASFADWDWLIGVNVTGVVNGIATWLPRMLAHGQGGHIVSTASMSAMMPHPGAVIYSSTKGFVITCMETMRAELEPKGILTHAFCPGAVQSNIARSGETRPAALAETGYAEADKQRQSGDQFAHLYMTKEEVGARVLQGMVNEELFILTHAEFREGLHDRTEAMRAAVPDRAINPDYIATFPRLMRNPAHAAEIARQKELKA